MFGTLRLINLDIANQRNVKAAIDKLEYKPRGLWYLCLALHIACLVQRRWGAPADQDTIKVGKRYGFLVWKDRNIVIFYPNDLADNPRKGVYEPDQHSIHCMWGLNRSVAGHGMKQCILQLYKSQQMSWLKTCSWMVLTNLINYAPRIRRRTRSKWYWFPYLHFCLMQVFKMGTPSIEPKISASAQENCGVEHPVGRTSGIQRTLKLVLWWSRHGEEWNNKRVAHSSRRIRQRVCAMLPLSSSQSGTAVTVNKMCLFGFWTRFSSELFAFYNIRAVLNTLNSIDCVTMKQALDENEMSVATLRFRKGTISCAEPTCTFYLLSRCAKRRKITGTCINATATETDREAQDASCLQEAPLRNDSQQATPVGAHFQRTSAKQSRFPRVIQDGGDDADDGNGDITPEEWDYIYDFISEWNRLNQWS